MHPEFLAAAAAARREELLREARSWHLAKQHGRRHARRWLVLRVRRGRLLPEVAADD